MTSTKYIRNLAFAALAFAIALVSACEKEEAAEPILTVPSTTTLESFGPTGALHGDTLSIIGYHLDRVTQVDLTGASVLAASFISKSAELIKIIIPVTTEPGYITLKSSDGDIVSKTILNLEVMPTITSVTAEARPGSNISIKGNHLNWVTSVTFAKALVETTFVSQTINEIVVKVPDNAESGKLLINYAGTKPDEFETTNSLTVTLPVATSFSPNPVKHQTNVTINGTDLDLVQKLNLPGVSAAIASTGFVSQSATQIVIKVPSETVNGKVTLYPGSNVPSVSSTDMTLTYPAITNMDPNPVAIASNLTITGTNLDLVKSVSFQGVASPVTTFVSQSATSIVVVVPVGSINGKVTLGIINTNQTVLSASALNIVGYVVPGGPAFPIFDDAIKWSGWIGGGWGGTYDPAIGSPVKRGTASLRISYVSGGYGVPLQLGGANISLAPYSSFTVSIYGGTGSNGKSVNIGFNEADGKTVTIVEGAWTKFDIPLGEISSASTLSFLYLKNYSGSGDFTIYVDDMGLN